MTTGGIPHWPSGLWIVVAVMFFPAIWGGALLVGAFAGDLIRRTKGRGND